MKSLFNGLKIRRKIIANLAAMHFYGNPSAKLKIVGVTGTNGKTTVATLMYRVATALGYKAGLIGTVENIIAGERRESTHTTPGPIFLNKLLREMVNRGCEYVFMEVSSHALDQKRVAGVKFTGGIFTNLTHDHLDYHKSFKNYFLAKKKFFDMLPEEAFALANIDDEHGLSMTEDIKARKFFYGFSDQIKDPALHDGKFIGEIYKMDFAGLDLGFNEDKVSSKLLGKFNAYNLLSVWGACQLLGFDMEKIKQIMKNIEPPTGRFEHFVSPTGVLVIVDYAHTPDALEKILLAILEFKSQYSKLISVFGCGGDRDPLKRRIMGKIGATHSDIAIFTSDNPRNENPESIIEEMKTDLSLSLSEKVRTISNRHEAILESVNLAQKGDIILCAGKGHETYQEIKGVRHHFNDIEEFQKVFDILKVK